MTESRDLIESCELFMISIDTILVDYHILLERGKAADE